MRFSIIFIILLFPLFISAQIGWLEGYVVTNSLDTLYGKIQYTTPAHRSVKCVFKENGYNDKVKYRPFTIRGYFVKGQYYVSRIYDIHPSLTYGLGVFMQLMNEGDRPVMVLEYRNTDQEMGFYQTFLAKKGVQSQEINPMKFKKSVAPFFTDYEELHKDIKKGVYKKKDLHKIVTRYNAWYKANIRKYEDK